MSWLLGSQWGSLVAVLLASILTLESSENFSSQKDLTGSLTQEQRKLRKEGKMAVQGEGRQIKQWMKSQLWDSMWSRTHSTYMPHWSRAVAAQHQLSCWLALSQVDSDIASGSLSLEASSPCSLSPPVFLVSFCLLHDFHNQCSSLSKRVTAAIFPLHQTTKWFTISSEYPLYFIP